MSSWQTRTRKRFSRLFLIVFTRTLSLAARLLPYRTAVAAGGLLGSLVYVLLPRERKRTLSHLAIAYPDQDRQWLARTARGTFVHLGKALLEAVAMDKPRLGAQVSFQGFENLTRAMAIGKGVVYFTGHIGNWELMAGAVAQTYSVSVVAAPIEPEPLNAMIVGLRASRGVRTILRGQPGAAKELIRVFRENRILGILIDQDTDVEGAFVDFMGRPAWTPTAAAQMAIKFDAPVIFGYARREADGRHMVTLEGPLSLIRTGNDEADNKANTAMFTKMIEDVVRRNPEQWVWMHRRWRRQS
jgi:KDO2-lipid IV(A) lauroyltransferase